MENQIQKLLTFKSIKTENQREVNRDELLKLIKKL